MVATSQPLAAQAGIEIMRQGGNAIDAAIATAAALTVVEPTSNGIGGDAFALVWVNNKLHGLNASGPAPESLTIDSSESSRPRKNADSRAYANYSSWSSGSLGRTCEEIREASIKRITCTRNSLCGRRVSAHTNSREVLENCL